MASLMDLGADQGGQNDASMQPFNWDQFTGGVTGQPTGAVDQPQSGAWNPGQIDAFRDAWYASGGTNTDALKAFVQAHPEYGATVTGSKGSKVLFPGGQAFQAVRSAGINGGIGAAWDDISGGGQQGAAGGGAAPYNFATDDPSYAWRFGQGQEAVQKSAAANGTLLTGGTLKDLTAFGQGMASTEYQNAFNRKGTLADLGLRATGAAVGAANNYGTGAASSYGNIGNANSAGSIAQGNIWGPFINNIGQR